MWILKDFICSKCGTISEGLLDTDSAGNTRYEIDPKCTCTDCYWDIVPSSSINVHTKGYLPGDARYKRGMQS